MDLEKTLASHRATLAIADYGIYHKYLTRRILSLRRKLGIATTKSQKYSHHEVTSEDVNKDVRQVELLLLQAERAWARAMHLKALRGEGEGGLTGRERNEVISKCAKAAKMAERIAGLAQAYSSTKSKDLVESRAYAAMLKGTELFEKLATGANKRSTKDWEACIVQWSTARVLYSVTAEKNGSDISSELITNTIDPTLRYATYQAGVPRTVSMQDVSRKNFAKDPGLKEAVESIDPWALTGRPRAYGEKVAKGEALQTIGWRGRNANIVDASIGQALAGVYAADAKLRALLAENPSMSTRDKAAAYDGVLVASQDAADATKRAIDELEKEKVDESDSRMQNARIAALATTYTLISWRVGRNRVLIGDQDGLTFTNNPPRHQKETQGGKRSSEESVGRRLALLKERVVLFDAILQSIESIKELPGAMRDETFVQELDDKIAYFRALRCVTISYSYLLCNERSNALALLTRAKELVTKVEGSGPRAVKGGLLTLELDGHTVKQAQSTIARLQAQSHALATLRQLEENAAVADAKRLTSSDPWINRLGDYPTPGVQIRLTDLVTYPPQLEPVPMKPIFLDIAWNYIDYPGQRPSSVSTAPTVNGTHPAAAGDEKKRGWFGFGRS